MADDFKISLQANLDKEISQRNIQSTLNEIKRNLSTDKGFQITASLSDKSLQNIQSQLRIIASNLNIDLSNIFNLGNLSNIQNQAREIGRTISDNINANRNNNTTSNLITRVQTNYNNGTYLEQLNQQSERYERLGLDIDTVNRKLAVLKNSYIELENALQNYNSIMASETSTQQQQIDALERLTTAENNFQNARRSTAQSISTNNSMYMSQTAVDSLIARLESFRTKNTAITKEAKAQIDNYISGLRNAGAVSKSEGAKVTASLRQIQVEQEKLGRLGLSTFDKLKQGLQVFSYLFSSVSLVMRAINGIKNAVNIVNELDYALVDLKKTAKMSSDELNNFYYKANDTAKQMGVTTNEIISQAAAWSRLGYSTSEAATQMAKYSSMFATISPGMDLDSATDGLVSVMKAFGIEVDDVVDGIMSKINIIGNTRALNNSDIVNFLTRSSSAMAEANNTLEDTIALGTAMTEITRDANNAGQVLKTVSMRIRGYDEETEEYIGGVEELSGKIADLTKTASTPGGISLFTDKEKTTFKSTRQLIEEISGIYDDLTDKTQAQLLEALAGKRNGQAVAALINNYDAVRDSLESMANSAGNAEAEMSVAMDSVRYKVNALKETGVGIAQNLFNREDMKDTIDGLQLLGNAIDFITEKLGLFGTASVAIGALTGVKDIGICI